MKIRNLTPHSIVILRDDDEGAIVGFTGVGLATREGRFAVVAEYQPEELVARAVQKDQPVGELVINGYSVPLIKTVFGAPANLPNPQHGNYLVVSILTAQAAKVFDRSTADLLIASDAVRTKEGKIIGIRKFALV